MAEREGFLFAFISDACGWREKLMLLHSSHDYINCNVQQQWTLAALPFTQHYLDFFGVFFCWHNVAVGWKYSRVGTLKDCGSKSAINVYLTFFKIKISKNNSALRFNYNYALEIKSYLDLFRSCGWFNNISMVYSQIMTMKHFNYFPFCFSKIWSNILALSVLL